MSRALTTDEAVARLRQLHHLVEIPYGTSRDSSVVCTVWACACTGDPEITCETLAVLNEISAEDHTHICPRCGRPAAGELLDLCAYCEAICRDCDGSGKCPRCAGDGLEPVRS